ncbi:hypothetical protein TcasGA2_TC031666 [Tribolium castaneum]|uniref:Uncharacterized protein n=1 Tax=Tribolium castaneum TaxID=7070 RepID=A0A139W9W0_TRICA|nr:PREDICTED: uncharacterized protein LOC103314835 [Tribolium castaneum]KYB24702.1 hypothetical protein TcasGA2_TC031666 [Tribolium castaneum]|eukprot:XP_008200092.1 PREDICTED: uncharacterized protein LOC103314835 [Tribolium castaneum]
MTEEQCIILYSKGERRLRMMTRYRDFQNEQILCKWCARQERKVWCMHIHIHNVTLTCTRCTTEILHRANLNCPRRCGTWEDRRCCITRLDELQSSQSQTTIGCPTQKAGLTNNFIYKYI